jgi:hypothetical protein
MIVNLVITFSFDTPKLNINVETELTFDEFSSSFNELMADAGCILIETTDGTNYSVRTERIEHVRFSL